MVIVLSVGLEQYNISDNEWSMSNRIFSIILFCFCFVASYAQSQCDLLLDAARKYKNEGEYEKAVDKYNKLEQKCPNYFTETVKNERGLCEKLKSQKSWVGRPLEGHN